MKIPFVGQAYEARSLNLDAQRCINLYPEFDPTGKWVSALFGTPGLDLLATVGGGPIRGSELMGSLLYVVSGAELYSVDSTWTATLLGTMTSSISGPVSMANNGWQVIIVDGKAGWLYTRTTGAFAKITDVDFPAQPLQVVYQDGWFIVTAVDTQAITINKTPDSGAVWTDGGTASASRQPDNIVSILSDHRELWLFGQLTTEVWYNSGNSDFPFEPIQGAFIEQGCAATFSACKMDNSVLWLGADNRGQGIIWRAQGYSPQRVSTHAIETAIAKYSTISDAQGYTYQDEGHTFYVLTFPTADKTWVYDAAPPGTWHERAYMTPTNGSLHRHRSNSYSFFNRRHVVGDWETGELYGFSLDTYTDNGDYIRAVRRCQHIMSDLKDIRHNQLQIDFEAGVGLQTGQGSSPQAMLRWSDDGGFTWSNEHWTTIGAAGKTTARAIWRRLGMSRDRIYELVLTDPVKRVILGATLDAQKARA